MMVSLERLRGESESTGFRPDVLEKVFQLLRLLELLQDHPFLKGRPALKGGTALNLFLFDLPRLSVDIDLIYVGAVERDAMPAEELLPRARTHKLSCALRVDAYALALDEVALTTIKRTHRWVPFD
jgi:predicted nucleotidyltransferase component of viral defense system